MILHATALPQIGIIGVKGYAAVLVNWLLEEQATGRIDIVAYVVLPQDEESETAIGLGRTGAQLFSDYQEMLNATAGKLDICFIPTGIQWHARMTIAALEAGCNVFVEKPLAGSAEDGQSVIEASTRSGKWVAIGFQDIYTDETAYLKSELITGRIGELKTVSMLGLWPRPAAYYARNNWAGRLWANGGSALDSPLNNALSHFVNLSLFLSGDTFETSTEALPTSIQLFRARSIESFDTAVALATASSGIDFWFGCSHSCKETLEPTIRIIGTKGHIEWKLGERCEIHSDEKPVETLNISKIDAARESMLKAIFQKLSKPSTRICEPQVAICHTKFIDSLHRTTTIADIDPELVEQTAHADTNSTVPTVRGLAKKLITAFENFSELADLKSQRFAQNPL